MISSKVINNHRYLGYFYGFLSALIFSGHYLIAKEVLKLGVQPLALSCLRGILGGGLLLLIFSKQISLNAFIQNKNSLLIVSIFGFFLSQIFFMHGLLNSTPTEAALFTNTIPLVTTFLAIVINAESVSRLKWLALFMGFAVLSNYIYQNSKDQTSFNAFGNFLIFLNVICFGLTVNYSKRLFNHISAPVVTGFILLSGGLMLFPFAYKDLPFALNLFFSSKQLIFYFVFEVAVATSIAWLCNFQSMKVLSISSATVMTYFQIPLTGLMIYLIDAHKPSMNFVVTSALVLIAVLLVVNSKGESRVS
jgi:drug/metabolite transporter (DMT)-like permease